jgi:hypothetical protein
MLAEYQTAGYGNAYTKTFRDVENPRLPLFNNRSVLLKYTYTFTL